MKTTKAAHTPGPWRVEEQRHNCGDLAIRGYDGLAELAYLQGLQSEPEVAANARLIAAAPEMLEALERIVEVSKTIPAIRGGSLTGAECRALDQAEAAIQKARGGQ